MSSERICDVCNKNKAVRSFKIKASKKGQYIRGQNLISWCDFIWTPYEKIDICSECGYKILGLTKLMDNGMLHFNNIPKKQKENN